MPAHTHNGTTYQSGIHNHTGTASATGAHTHTVTTSNLKKSSSNDGESGDWGPATTRTTSSNGSHAHTVIVSDGGAHSHGLNIDETGEGKSHNILTPFIAVYFYRRTA